MVWPGLMLVSKTGGQMLRELVWALVGVGNNRRVIIITVVYINNRQLLIRFRTGPDVSSG